MAQEISIETAFDCYRTTAADLFHENVLLKARLKEVESELDQVRSSEPDPHPSMVGPVAEQG